MGMFYPFVENTGVRLVGVEAGGHGIQTGSHGATLGKGTPGILHGMKTYVLHDDDGQIAEAHSISAGLDYPGVGCEHSYLKDSKRAEYVSITDEEAIEGFQLLSREEGLIPALESAHAIAYVAKVAPTLKPEQIIAVCLSGRGDKDVQQTAQYMGVEF